MANIAVVYLARFAEGPEPVRRFIESYRRHGAGMPHDLIIVWKGFPELDPSGSPQKAICDQVTHRSVTMTDDGVDLTAYDIASRQIDHDYVCCLNTFSLIQSDDWLLKLYQHISIADVGIAGATGSYESLGRSMRLINKAMWLCIHNIPYDPVLAAIWPDQIVKFNAAWLERTTSTWLQRKRYEWFGWRIHESYERHWKTIGLPYEGFPDFPNPHLRSNAFAMRREELLSMMPQRIFTKHEAFEFESGARSATRKLMENGKKVLVVGADGLGYEPNDWRDSQTFRRGTQHNNLVADNQTTAFDAMGGQPKFAIESLTWGLFRRVSSAGHRLSEWTTVAGCSRRPDVGAEKSPGFPRVQECLRSLT